MLGVAKVGRSNEQGSLRLVWVTKQDLVSIPKKTRAWWQVPVVPAAQEAEAGGSLEPGRSRLQ